MTFKEKLERAFEEKYSSCKGIFYNTMRSVALWAASFALESTLEKVEFMDGLAGPADRPTRERIANEIRAMKESLNDR